VNDSISPMVITLVVLGLLCGVVELVFQSAAHPCIRYETKPQLVTVCLVQGQGSCIYSTTTLQDIKTCVEYKP